MRTGFHLGESELAENFLQPRALTPLRSLAKCLSCRVSVNPVEAEPVHELQFVQHIRRWRHTKHKAPCLQYDGGVLQVSIASCLAPDALASRLPTRLWVRIRAAQPHSNTHTQTPTLKHPHSNTHNQPHSDTLKHPQTLKHPHSTNHTLTELNLYFNHHGPLNNASGSSSASTGRHSPVHLALLLVRACDLQFSCISTYSKIEWSHVVIKPVLGLWLAHCNCLPILPHILICRSPAATG